MKKDLEVLFPKLSNTGYEISSDASTKYNCIAWAAETTERWWEPSPRRYWPPGTPRDLSTQAFIDAFESIGYQICKDEGLQSDFQKVAIYTNQSGTPTHMARQLENGRWTSKLGTLEDIEHDLEDLTGSDYGQVKVIMRRRIC